MDFTLTCSTIGHENQQILWICPSQFCQSRLVCPLCLTKLHAQHAPELILISEYHAWRDEGIKVTKQLNNLLFEALNEIKSCIKPLKCFMEQWFIKQTFNITGLTREELRKEVDLIARIKSEAVQEVLSTQLQKLKKQFKVGKDICQKLDFETLSDIQIAINTVKKSQIPKITKDFIFSKSEKPGDMCVDQQRTTAQNNGGNIKFILLEPQIPIDQIAQIILEPSFGEPWYIGLCRRDEIRKFSYEPPLSQLCHGCYLINNWGVVFSHHDIDINYQAKAFSFTYKDQILLQVDAKKKLITWARNYHLPHPEVFSIGFELKDNMYLAVGLGDKSKINIK